MNPVVLLNGGRGYVCFAASRATAAVVSFAVRHTTGYLRVAIDPRRADQLELPSLDGSGYGHAVSVDAANVASTGISAADRAHTITLLARPDATPADFTRPGHVVPVRAGSTGLCAAAIELAVRDGLFPACALAELVSERRPTELADTDEAIAFARSHGLAVVSDVPAVRHAPVRRGSAAVRTPYGTFTAISYDSRATALVAGDLGDGTDVLAAVHAECVAGELFGSVDCSCRDRLDWSLATVARAGRGVVVHLPLSTVDASAIFDDLGVRSVRPMPVVLAVRP